MKSLFPTGTGGVADSLLYALVSVAPVKLIEDYRLEMVSDIVRGLKVVTDHMITLHDIFPLAPGIFRLLWMTTGHVVLQEETVQSREQMRLTLATELYAPICLL